METFIAQVTKGQSNGEPGYQDYFQSDYGLFNSKTVINLILMNTFISKNGGEGRKIENKVRFKGFIYKSFESILK